MLSFPVNRQNQIAIHNNNYQVCNAITYDDRPGHEQQYDAFVLYAKEDRQFVNELMDRMTAAGFQVIFYNIISSLHTTNHLKLIISSQTIIGRTN